MAMAGVQGRAAALHPRHWEGWRAFDPSRHPNRMIM